METVISLCSVAIALGALSIAVYEGYVTRRHNRLSTKPHLSFKCDLQKDSPQVNVMVRNNGLGPAVLKAFEVGLRGKVPEPLPWNGWLNLVEQAGFPPGIVVGTVLNEGDSIAPGQSHHILTIELATAGPDRDQIAQWVSNITINVTYESIYKETFLKQFKLT